METELSITDDIETIVLMAFSTITSEDCRAWVENIGLYTIISIIQYTDS